MTNRNFETKISNCDICNQYQLLRIVYEDNWLCNSCVRRIKEVYKQNPNSELTYKEILDKLRNYVKEK